MAANLGGKLEARQVAGNLLFKLKLKMGLIHFNDDDFDVGGLHALFPPFVKARSRAPLEAQPLKVILVEDSAPALMQLEDTFKQNVANL